MNILVCTLVFTVLLQCCTAPPVTKNKEKEEEEEEANGDAFQLVMHYHRYLKQVVSALESDPDFKKKLETADESDIRSGKIANELEFVSHNVRSRLDEIKRHELERLRSLARQKQQLNDNEIIDDPNHGHIDHSNTRSFEIEDLKKLIAKTTEDLAEADRRRKEEFKQYELQKEYEKQDKLNHTNGDERKKLEEHYKEVEEKHKKHQPLHEPGHKAQLEEVWEEQDHMQQEFNPKTFFMMHDLDSNGLWDQDEVKALFVKELDKLYAAGAPEDDLRERVEEMERMRETVFQEVDTNRDGFIDFHEFLVQTKKQDFQQDHGWKGLDEQKPYTDEELEQYIRQQQMMHPPPGYHMPPPGHYPPPEYHPQQGYQNYHPNQVPQHAGYPPQQQQQFQQGYQQQGGHPQQFQQQGGHPQQFQQQGGHPQQFQPQGVPNQMGHGQNNPPLNTNEVYPNQQQQQHQQVQPPQNAPQAPVQQQNIPQPPQQQQNIPQPQQSAPQPPQQQPNNQAPVQNQQQMNQVPPGGQPVAQNQVNVDQNQQGQKH